MLDSWALQMGVNLTGCSWRDLVARGHSQGFLLRAMQLVLQHRQSEEFWELLFTRALDYRKDCGLLSNTQHGAAAVRQSSQQPAPSSNRQQLTVTVSNVEQQTASLGNIEQHLPAAGSSGRHMVAVDSSNQQSVAASSRQHQFAEDSSEAQKTATTMQKAVTLRVRTVLRKHPNLKASPDLVHDGAASNLLMKGLAGLESLERLTPAEKTNLVASALGTICSERCVCGLAGCGVQDVC